MVTTKQHKEKMSIDMQSLHFISKQDQILSPNQWWKSIHH